MTLVDTNVLIDIVSNDPIWFDWSIDALAARGSAGPLLVNGVIYAELSARMTTEAAVNAAIGELDVELMPSPRLALFLAGQAFRQYRLAGGTRTGVLPDLLIGAHAQVLGCPVLTRDVGRFCTYFPEVTLITPES